ncbi:porin [Stutzerimonas kirkiae]|uniref:Porin n=1 Tax=Stutzerimonas kirkiae TaxID=2211392 RepID=A0A4Q9RGC4_9GAMM|nr:porin [Stutzerimonas kirkiae]TBU99935.1 porin [Stutzerimonas kirkiae]TBV05641.1 porin [Stutzerimonas kirkiae]TBV10618.1 porin [Stutzerimonas kirkiae]TBV17473.1 porin [Stutzerimonas kirkiae]
MYKNKKALIPLTLASTVAMALSQTANAEIVLYDKDDTTFSTDGYMNAFYVHSNVDSDNDVRDRNQSRVKMGFLPSWIGFNFGKQIDGLQLGGRASFWVTINDSDDNGTGTDIDVRQFYGTVSSPQWGEVLVGKDFGLFGRSNIFLDELLAGYGNVSDSLGLVDGNGVSFGNIGTGYVYAFPTSQITYRNNNLAEGLRVAVGIMDTFDSNQLDSSGVNDKAYQDKPRFESEISYQFELGGSKIYSWVNGTYQNSKNSVDNPGAYDDDLTSKGLGYGVQAKLGGLSLTASGFQAKGINPFFSNNAGQAILRDTDSDGYLLQGSYTFGKNRIALSYGQTKDDGNGLGAKADYETRGIAYFRTINDNLKLVAEYNVHETDAKDVYVGAAAGAGSIPDVETKTFAVGAVVSW